MATILGDWRPVLRCQQDYPTTFSALQKKTLAQAWLGDVEWMVRGGKNACTCSRDVDSTPLFHGYAPRNTARHTSVTNFVRITQVFLSSPQIRPGPDAREIMDTALQRVLGCWHWTQSPSLHVRRCRTCNAFLRVEET